MDPYWAEDLDGSTCDHAGPDCSCDGPIYFHSRCHVRAPTWARYVPRERTLEIICSKCERSIVAIRVAVRHEALPDG